MDNPVRLATFGTQNEEKQSKNTTQYANSSPPPIHHAKYHTVI
jgi:hypothetical protein